MSEANQDPEDRHFLVSEVANMFCVIPKTVLNWIKRGDLGAIKHSRIYRIPKSALVRFAKRSRPGRGSKL